MFEIAPHEQNFYHAIDQQPDNLDLQLIYADWLEENADPRADLIRELVDFHQGKTDNLDLSDPPLLWSALRAFAPPREGLMTFSPFQKRMLPVWSRLWMQIGVSTQRTDRARAEVMLREAYRITQKREPRHIDWFESPLGAWREVTGHKKVKFVEWFENWWPNEGTNADPSLQSRASSTISSRIGTVVGNGVSGRVQREITAQLGSASQSEALYCEYGAWAAYGLSVPSFFHHVCGLSVHPAMRCAFHLALDLGIWFPLSDRAILSEKPEILLLEEDSLKCISYRDGFRLEPPNKDSSE